jgi:protein O-GlcNAc transferase
MAQVERWLREAGDLLREGDAARAEDLCRRAREARPDDPAVARELARALAARHRHPEAAEVLEEALKHTPEHAPEHASVRAGLLRALGHARWFLWDYAGARDAFAAAHRADPGGGSDIENLLFAGCYDPDLAPDALAALHREWAPRLLAGVPAPDAPRPDAPDPDRPLKVGYLSPDFRKHPVSVFLGSVVAFHHPEAVVTHCYSAVAEPDGVTQAFARICPNWHDVTGMDDAALARRVRADGIDILVDLAGFTGGSRVRVLGRRPAPVQVSYLGYPATTGLPVVDWRLTDAVANPEGTDAFYTERLARVAGGLCCYLPPPDAPDPGPPPALKEGRITFGSLVNLKKVNRPTIALWSRVLQAVPGARLLLFRHTFEAPSMRERYLAEFARHGIDPERVEIGWQMPPVEEGHYFAVYRRVDAVLDTLPFNGHTSTCEALWMGVPVLTLAGADFAGRLSASMLRMAGLGGLVTDTPDAFVAAAGRLASDVQALARLRRTLRGHLSRTRLLDAEGCTRAVEAAYRAMWRDWCAGRGGPGRAARGPPPPPPIWAVPNACPSHRWSMPIVATGPTVPMTAARPAPIRRMPSAISRAGTVVETSAMTPHRARAFGVSPARAGPCSTR